MRTRRGISSVVGMVFGIIAIATSIGYVTYSMNLLDQYNQSVLARNQISIDKGYENFQVSSVKISNGKFNVTVVNTGNLPINITKMWVQNTTATDWDNFYSIGKLVSPGNTVTNIGQSSALSYKSSQSYNLKLVTGRGNTMQFSVGSQAVNPVTLQLQIIPHTLRSYSNASLVFIVTNNYTNNNLLTNISPNVPSCSTTGGATFTLKSGPNPPQYSYLPNGGTAIFQWDYNAIGANNTRITCTDSLNNGVASNTATDTALITTLISPATNQTTPSDPTGTSSTTGVMMGLGVGGQGGQIKPKISGNVLIIISGDIKSDTSGDGGQVQIRYSSTYPAPANAAALTGTTCGGLVKALMSSSTNKYPFSVQCVASGLTVGTKYWIDLGAAAITGGTISIKDVSISAFEED